MKDRLEKQKKKYKIICGVSIIIALILYIVFRMNQRTYYDISFIKDGRLESFILNGVNIVGIYDYEIENKEEPQVSTDIIIDEIDMEVLQNRFANRVNIYIANRDGAYFFADKDGNFDTFVENIIDEKISNLNIEGRVSGKTDIESIKKNNYEITYGKYFRFEQDIEKWCSKFSNDQKLTMAVMYKKMKRKYASMVQIMSHEIAYFSPMNLVNAGESYDDVNIDDIKVEFNSLMNRIGMDYVIKDMATEKAENLQFYLLGTGLEECTYYYIGFNQKIDDIEVLDCNDCLENSVGLHSQLNSSECDFVEGKIYSFVICDFIDVESVKYSVDINKTVEDIYHKFEQYVKDNDREFTCNEIHPYNISIKYIMSYNELIPVYAVTATVYTYNYETNTWTRQVKDYLFEIDGVDYSKCRE